MPSQRDACVRRGVELLQGFFFERPRISEDRSAPAGSVDRLRAVVALRGAPTFEEVEEVVGGDPGLTIRLLRFANSAAVGSRRRFSSVREAMILLGAERVRQFMLLVLLSELGEGRPALVSAAIMRGRLCEKLAIALGTADPDTAFTAGVLSTADALLDQPLFEVVKTLPVTEELKLGAARPLGPGRHDPRRLDPPRAQPHRRRDPVRRLRRRGRLDRPRARRPGLTRHAAALIRLSCRRLGTATGMKAVVWHGKRDVRVDNVPDPTIQEPTDAIVRITSTNICGSDLHLYEVLSPFMTEGDILGHEPMGIVEEVGSGLNGDLKVGDRVVMPFQISCGSCYMCDQQLFTQCETTQVREEGMGAALFGYTKLYGQVPGGQAEFLRVPQAQNTTIKVPDDGAPDDRYVYLSDVLPTAWQARRVRRRPRGRDGRRPRPRPDRRHGLRASRCTRASASSASTSCPSAWRASSSAGRRSSTSPSTRTTSATSSAA